MCIVTVLAEAGHGEQRPLQRHEVGDHRDGLDGDGVGVRPTRELVQVVADARDLRGALALDSRPPPRSTSAPSPAAVGRTAARRPQSPWARQAARGGGDTRAWMSTVCGTQPLAHRQEGAGARPPALPRAPTGRGMPGVRRGRAAPPRQPDVAHRVGWLLIPNGVRSQLSCSSDRAPDSFSSLPGSSSSPAWIFSCSGALVRCCFALDACTVPDVRRCSHV